MPLDKPQYQYENQDLILLEIDYLFYHKDEEKQQELESEKGF